MPTSNLPPNFCNEDGFRPYFNKYIHVIYNYVLRKVGDPDRAKDITECAFITLLENCKKIKNEKHFVGFLYRTARNLILQYQYNDVQRRLRVREAEIIHLLQNEQSIMSDLDYVLHHQLSLHKAFLKLPARKRRIIVLYFFHGMSIAAIGLRLGIAEQTVRNHLSQAIAFLRTELLSKNGNNYPGFLS